MISLLAATVLTSQQVNGPSLLDARCDTAEYARAARQVLGSGVTLFARHDATYVTLCFTLPEGSLGTLDMFVQAANGSLHNLHVSAQVGERERGPEGWPEWRFGNQQGWYGPPLGISRLEVINGRARITGAPALGRELQIRRERFGPGPWRVRFELRALEAAHNVTLQFPENSNDSDPAGWARLVFTDSER